MVKLNRIYTRSGDDGTTGLVDGSRLVKNAARIAAIGLVDEANSAIGLALVAVRTPEPAGDHPGRDHIETLRAIQNDLFDLGADLATPGEDFSDSTMLRVLPAAATWLEGQIDALNADLAPLTSFILPGGSEKAARVHVARATVRHAERAMVALAQGDAVNPAALSYINRLSDYLFVLARALNAGGAGDVLWVPGASRKR